MGHSYGNTIDKLRKIWSQFSPEVLQVTILDIKDKCQYLKQNSALEQNLYLHNQIHDIINQNTSKRKEEEFQILSRITKKSKLPDAYA